MNKVGHPRSYTEHSTDYFISFLLIKKQYAAVFVAITAPGWLPSSLPLHPQTYNEPLKYALVLSLHEYHSHLGAAHPTVIRPHILTSTVAGRPASPAERAVRFAAPVGGLGTRRALPVRVQRPKRAVLRRTHRPSQDLPRLVRDSTTTRLLCVSDSPCFRRESFPVDHSEELTAFLLGITGRSIALHLSKVILRKLFVAVRRPVVSPLSSRPHHSCVTPSYPRLPFALCPRTLPVGQAGLSRPPPRSPARARPPKIFWTSLRSPWRR